MSLPKPAVSLVIPSIDRPQMLLEAIESVLAGVEVPAEIIVIDQSRQPNEVLESYTSDRCELRYTWTPVAGVSRARNLGLRMASFPLVAFIDDDVRVHPEWFGTLVDAIVAAGDRAVVSGRVTAESPAHGSGFAASTIDDPEPTVHRGRIDRDVLYTGNMVLPRSAGEGVGLFDERLGGGAPFPAAEDNDFGHRLRQAGYRVHYAPEAIVEHRAWRTGGGAAAGTLALRTRSGGFYAKHFSLPDRHMLRRAARDAGGGWWPGPPRAGADGPIRPRQTVEVRQDRVRLVTTRDERIRAIHSCRSRSTAGPRRAEGHGRGAVITSGPRARDPPRT